MDGGERNSPFPKTTNVIRRRTHEQVKLRAGKFCSAGHHAQIST
jgi:hypothetical protein